jgi:hypothetical protein
VSTSSRGARRLEEGAGETRQRKRKVTTRFDPRALSDRIQELLVLSDGKLLAAGQASIGDFNHDWNVLFGLARYLTI